MPNIPSQIKSKIDIDGNDVLEIVAKVLRQNNINIEQVLQNKDYLTNLLDEFPKLSKIDQAQMEKIYHGIDDIYQTVFSTNNLNNQNLKNISSWYQGNELRNSFHNYQNSNFQYQYPNYQPLTTQCPFMGNIQYPYYQTSKNLDQPKKSGCCYKEKEKTTCCQGGNNMTNMSTSNPRATVSLPNHPSTVTHFVNCKPVKQQSKQITSCYTPTTDSDFVITETHIIIIFVVLAIFVIITKYRRY